MAIITRHPPKEQLSNMEILGSGQTKSWVSEEALSLPTLGRWLHCASLETDLPTCVGKLAMSMYPNSNPSNLGKCRMLFQRIAFCLCALAVSNWSNKSRIG